MCHITHRLVTELHMNDTQIDSTVIGGHIRQRELLSNVLPVSSATLWRMVKRGAFPRPIKLSDRVTAWRIEEVKAWLQSREAVMAAPRPGTKRKVSTPR